MIPKTLRQAIARKQAARWLAILESEKAEKYQDEFEKWLSASAYHQAAYIEAEEAWKDPTKFVPSSTKK